VLSLGWQAKKNADLVQSIRRLMARFPKLSLVKVPGHQGVADNERADALATSAIRQGGKI
jgi:ribonuclease HI